MYEANADNNKQKTIFQTITKLTMHYVMQFIVDRKFTNISKSYSILQTTTSRFHYNQGSVPYFQRYSRPYLNNTLHFVMHKQ